MRITITSTDLHRAAESMRASAESDVDLAVAEWLDHDANRAKEMDGYEDSAVYPLMVAGHTHALKVARAQLGEDPNA